MTNLWLTMKKKCPIVQRKPLANHILIKPLVIEQVDRIEKVFRIYLFYKTSFLKSIHLTSRCTQAFAYCSYNYINDVY